MYSGDAPPSFLSAGMKPFNQEQFQVDPQAFGVDQPWLNQPPSQGSLGHDQGNSLTQFQDGNGYRGFGQTDPTLVVDSEKMPSFTAFGRGISHNHDGISNRDSGYGGQPLSIGAMVKAGFSNPGGGDPYAVGSAPGLSDVGRREQSQTGDSSSNLQTSSDPQHYVGMSLVGKNFKKYYPDAYYKEKDGYL